MAKDRQQNGPPPSGKAAFNADHKGLSTNWQGHDGEFTGHSNKIYGGTFHEVHIVSGPLKGQKKWTQVGPGMVALPVEKPVARKPVATPQVSWADVKMSPIIMREQAGGGGSQAFQTGAKGGQFYTTATGRKVYKK